MAGGGVVWRLTRACPFLFGLVLVSGCGRSSPTSPSRPFFLECELPTLGAMTATLDGTPWIPVSTSAYKLGSSVSLQASDCRYQLRIDIGRFNGLGTYDVAAGDVRVFSGCDGGTGLDCGHYQATATTDGFGKTTVTGSGSLTVTAYTPPTPGVLGSGAIEGTFSFTMLGPFTMLGVPGTRVMTNGRFGSRFTNALGG
jgi:hypothetical protein